MIYLDKKLRIDQDTTLSPNLTGKFSEDDLRRIGAEVVSRYKRDRMSRERWEQRMEAGMELAMQVQKAKTFPWPDCANITFPLVTIAALQFHARAYPALVNSDLVKCTVSGPDPQ